MIDLGEWAAEEKAIPGQTASPEQQSAIDIEAIEAMLAKQQDSFFKE